MNLEQLNAALGAYFSVHNLYTLLAGDAANNDNTFDQHRENPRMRYRNMNDSYKNPCSDVVMKYNNDGATMRGNGFNVTFTVYLPAFENFWLQFKAGNDCLKLGNGVFTCEYLGP